MTVQSLKEAILELPEEERQCLSIWLNGFDSDDWDQEMLRDFSPEGRGAHLVEKVKADIAAGKFRPVAEFCAEQQQKRK